MASTKYTYSIQNDTPNHKVDTDRLIQEITTSTITIALDYINTNGDELDIWFKAELSTEEQTELTTIVNNHSGEPLPSSNTPVSIKESDVDLTVTEKGFQNLDGHIYFKKGVCLECASGGITNLDVKFDRDMLLCGGGCRTDENTTFGDYCEFFIVDKDNLLGYGTNLEICKLVETDYVWADKFWEVLFQDAKPIPAGFYLRIAYTSVGQNAVKVIAWFNMREASATVFEI